MKILWTASNWKRTGPLEPSLDLAAAMAAREHAVHVAVGRAPEVRADEAAVAAERRGLALALTGARLAKHAAPWRNARDARRLAGWLRRERPDGCVATQRNDHRLLLAAARRLGAGAPPVVRLFFSDGHAAIEARDARALRRSAGVLVFGETARGRVAALGVPETRIGLAGPPLDLTGLRAHVGDAATFREGRGVPRGSFLFGIVARMQTHRRFELLWDAVGRLEAEGLPVHLHVIGRGTNEAEVGHRPVAERRLSHVVTFLGYLRGRAYATALAALDAQVFLVPGSDPTCRALREGMALGVPSLATRRGMLPELVEDGVTGRLVAEDAGALAEAMAAFVRDRAAAAAMGQAARARAEARFDAAAAARLLDDLFS